MKFKELAGIEKAIAGRGGGFGVAGAPGFVWGCLWASAKRFWAGLAGCQDF